MKRGEYLKDRFTFVIYIMKAPLKPCNIQLFEVASNSILNRACPIPYSLKDTTFYLFLSLANENLSYRFMNRQMFICS